MDLLLCGDVGGTHTRLALFEPGHPHDPVASDTLGSREFAGFLPLLSRFLDGRSGLKLRSAAFGIPGPASAGRDELWMVNLPWRIHVSEVARKLGLPRVQFINDFAAVALAVPHLKPIHLHALGGGAAVPHEPIAVLGAGTGLGESFLVWTGTRYLPVATECGHADFAPRTPVEMRLLEYLQERERRRVPRPLAQALGAGSLGHRARHVTPPLRGGAGVVSPPLRGGAREEVQLTPVPWEAVLSGPGLVNLAEWVRDGEHIEAAPALRAALEQARDDAPAVITRLALARVPDPLCARAVELFCTLYGAEAGNAALRVVAAGGVYLAGGIAPQLLGPLSAPGFRQAFEAKYGFAELLRTIPVWVITHPNPGLLGAAIAAQEEAETV